MDADHSDFKLRAIIYPMTTVLCELLAQLETSMLETTRNYRNNVPSTNVNHEGSSNECKCIQLSAGYQPPT